MSIVNVYKFQFPSNGKAHSDACGIPYPPPRCGESVSIPFKREGSFGPDTAGGLKTNSMTSCFNSLQTGRLIRTNNPHGLYGHGNIVFQFPSNGKAHSDLKMWDRKSLSILSFNSLQTGRLIRTHGDLDNLHDIIEQVSIPFKREGSFGQEKRIKSLPSTNKFQFPSNGKAHSDVPRKPPLTQSSEWVSIPFKREGSFGPIIKTKKCSCGSEVSIPFKREGSFGQQKKSFGTN